MIKYQRKKGGMFENLLQEQGQPTSVDQYEVDDSVVRFLVWHKATLKQKNHECYRNEIGLDRQTYLYH